VTLRGEDQWDLIVTTAPSTEADQEKSRLVRGSLRIHHTRRRASSGSSGAGQSGDGKRLALVSLGRSRAPVCIILLTRVSRALSEPKLAAATLGFPGAGAVAAFP
jgi:hypothetical protein